MTAQWRWITFDCFGTLVDWQAGFAGALRPLAGDRTEELVRAYHAHEAVVERLTPAPLVQGCPRDGAAESCSRLRGADLARGGTRVAGRLGVDAGVRRRRADAGRAASARLEAGRAHELRRGSVRGDAAAVPSTVRSGPDSRAGARLQAGEVAFPRVRAVDASRSPQLGARGEQLVSRHRAGAGVGHSTRLARSGSDGRDGCPGAGPRAYRSGRAASRPVSGGACVLVGHEAEPRWTRE